MEGRNPRKGCAALVLGHYHQRRAGVARIRQTWLPPGRIRQPDEASQPASRVPGSGSAGGLLRNPPEGAFTPARTCPGRLRRPFVIAGPRSAALAGVGVTSETAAGPRRLWAITPTTTFLCGRWRQRPQPGEAADQSDTVHSLGQAPTPVSGGRIVPFAATPSLFRDVTLGQTVRYLHSALLLNSRCTDTARPSIGVPSGTVGHIPHPCCRPISLWSRHALLCVGRQTDHQQGDRWEVIGQTWACSP
jgi:hypothetical protein